MVELTANHIHFIGIGGVHMSGLAHMLQEKGKIVTGSDASDNERCQKLRDSGVIVYLGHKKEQIAQSAEWVIINAAVPMDNEELIEARQRGLRVLDRPELIGIIMKAYPVSIAVGGTHGKTTTTSMIAHCFYVADLDPTVLNGGFLPILGGYYHQGGGPHFIVEACEYKNSFLDFNPTLGLILNVEMDHPDFFADIDAVYQSFREFAKKIPPEGILVINEDILHIDKIIKELPCQIITFGRSERADFRAHKISMVQGKPSFTLRDKIGDIGEINLQVFGEYNIDNALGAAATWLSLGGDREKILPLLNSFTTVNRRFEKKGEINAAQGNLYVYDDFAHHPTEIKKTIHGAKAADLGPVVVIFEPHTYHRTFTLYDDFVEAFDEVDLLIVLDIYSPAGREDTFPVDARQLAADIQRRGVDAQYMEEAEAIKYIHNFVHKGLLLTMGAGNVYKLGEKLLKKDGEL